MQTDCGIEQLLARAILDLELKMKHEMRQNSALQLAKIEKHSQQMEKRLGIVEAKLEALLSRDNNSSGGGGMGGPNSHHLHYRGGTRQPQYSSAGSINRQTSYYSRTANLANGHGHHPGDKIPRTTTPISRTHPHYGPMFGSQSNTPQHHRQQHFASGGGGNERKQQRPKQMVGTGANKTQIVQQPQEKPPLIPKNETWTTKLGGVYTSGEDSDEENGRSGSESCYSVAKPAPKCGEIVSADEEKPNKEYSDEDEEEEEDGEIIDEEKNKEKAKGVTGEMMMMVLKEEEEKTTKTAISRSNCTFKSSLEEEIVMDDGKKKKVDDDEEEEGEDNNQLSFNTAKESDSFLNVTIKQQCGAIALPFHDYEYPLLMEATSSSNDNALKIVETKEEKKKEKMTTIVSTEKTAQMPSAPAQTIGGFGRGRRN